MSSSPMKSMGGEAVAVRIYWKSGADFTEVATLSPIAPPRMVEGSVEVPEVDMEHGGGNGLYLALVQGGRVIDIAQMLFYGGDSGNEDGGADCYSECYSTDLSTCGVSSSRSSSDVNEGDRHMFGLMGCEEDEEAEEEEETTSSQEEGMSTNSNDSVGRENNGGFFRSIFWQQVNDDLGSDDDVEDLEKSTSSEEEGHKKKEEGHKEEEGHTEEDIQTVQMKLRLWPLQKHVLVKIFRGTKWVLTKDYCLLWLKFEEMNEFDLEVDYDGLHIFRESAFVMDFEIMAPSSVLNDAIDMMKPSICNFTILKKVGGEKVCRVFKCLWLGNTCALKTISQQISCSAEPREIAIISSLKDKRIMTFFQAWREPWVYKERPEQEHVFIHLEFCPRTLKHAFYENSDWIQDRWFIFEEIVQGIKEVHAKCVVHRDLKPDNIFFGSDDGVRIGDFGDACSGHDEFGRYGGGTPDLGTQYYLAPELDSGQKITEKADIFSAGVILFELFALFETVYEKAEVFPTLRQKGPPDSWEGDRQLFAKMTDPEPSHRPSATEVLAYIHQHHRL